MRGREYLYYGMVILDPNVSDFKIVELRIIETRVRIW